MDKFALFAIVVSFIVISGFNFAYGADSSGRVNWLEICRNPLVDAVVVERCKTLTSPDGYTLTKEGQRVAACVIGGGLLAYVDPTGQALIQANSLASISGMCRSVAAPLTEGNSHSSQSNPLGNLLGGILGIK